MIQRTQEEIEDLLYPELRSCGRRDRDRLLRVATKTSLDLIEWAGILAALVAVVTSRGSEIAIAFRQHRRRRRIAHDRNLEALLQQFAQM